MPLVPRLLGQLGLPRLVRFFELRSWLSDFQLASATNKFILISGCSFVHDCDRCHHVLNPYSPMLMPPTFSTTTAVAAVAAVAAACCCCCCWCCCCCHCGADAAASATAYACPVYTCSCTAGVTPKLQRQVPSISLLDPFPPTSFPVVFFPFRQTPDFPDILVLLHRAKYKQIFNRGAWGKI